MSSNVVIQAKGTLCRNMKCVLILLGLLRTLRFRHLEGATWSRARQHYGSLNPYTSGRPKSRRDDVAVMERMAKTMVTSRRRLARCGPPITMNLSHMLLDLDNGSPA